MLKGFDGAALVKGATDIYDVIRGYVQLRKSGADRWIGPCPFHSEKTPSLTVDTARQAFRCWGCGVHGDVIDFIQKIEGGGFRDALARLADRAGIRLDDRTPEERHTYAIRRRRAEALAADLTAWRGRLLDRLILLRNAYQNADRTICEWAAINLTNPLLADDTDLWDTIHREVYTYGQRALECEQLIEQIEAMAPRDMAALQRQIGPIHPDAIGQLVNQYLFEIQHRLEREAAAEREIAK